jgi:uncharacterized protein with ParB-like and HNH nuclease domain
MKISTILDKIDERQLFVPAFQREYVWKREDAKELIDSLVKSYPTGTMLTWETNKPPELKGQHVYDEKQGAVRILLDGQQRITTLYMLRWRVFWSTFFRTGLGGASGARRFWKTRLFG